MNKAISLLLGAIVVSTVGVTTASAAVQVPTHVCVPLPVQVGSQEVLGQRIPGVSKISACVTSKTGAAGEPQLRRYEGCGDPCFAIVVRNLAIDVDTSVTLSYSLDGRPQTLPVSTGSTRITPLDGIHNCVYAYHAPGTASPCQDGISTPAELQARGGRSKVALTWNRSFAFGESNVDGYEIWRSESGEEGTFTQIAVSEDLDFSDTGLKNGASYWYQVVAFDTDGLKSGASNTASATTK